MDHNGPKEGPANFFFEGPNSKYFRLCGPGVSVTTA